MLVLLIFVLPLQSVLQLGAGVQGHRHMHTGAAQRSSVLAGLTQPLRAVLDRLHAAQDPRLKGPSFGWTLSRGPAEGLHEHGGVFHRHTHDTADVVDVGDTADNPVQGGATAFLAWLPCALALAAGQRDACPADTPFDWRDRVVAPPLTPPRG
ncbi:MAG: hypothetical protein JF607_16405 [Burkholderiales bacterium]|nr:hypothetical protein [Burkholderiales bacterium]